MPKKGSGYLEIAMRGGKWRACRMSTEEGTNRVRVAIMRGDTSNLEAHELGNSWGSEFLVSVSQTAETVFNYVTPKEAADIMSKWRQRTFSRGYRPMFS